MIGKLVRGIRKHERLAVFILAIVVASVFGIPSAVFTLLEKKERGKASAKILGREITAQEVFDVKIRWQALTKLRIRQFGYLPTNFPFNMAEHKQFVFFQEGRLISAISSSEENYTIPGDEYYDNLAQAILVLRTLAEHTGIKVTPKEIRSYIESYPVLKPRQGGFNLKYYQTVIRQSFRISESAFEKTVGEFLQIVKYANLTVESTTPTLEKMYQVYLHNNEETKIRWISFKPQDFQDEVRIKSPEEIEQFFQNNKDNYQVPEKIQIEYILADYELFKKSVREPTPKDLKDYYEKHKELFKITDPKIPDDSSVFIYKPFEKAKDEVKSKWQEEKARDLAINNIIKADDKIKQLVVRDKPVALKTMAREFFFKYGTTGFFSQDRISEIAKEVGSSDVFARQVFAYSEKDISCHLSTSKGFIIFRVLKKKPARTLEFTMDFKEKVIKDLKEKKAKELAHQKVDELAQEISDKVSEELETIEDKPDEAKEKLTKEIRKKWFKDIIATKGLESVETLYFKRRDFIPELSKNTFQFNEKVFELNEGDFKVISDTIKSRIRKEDHEIYYLVQVMARRLPTGDDFETQKDDLESQIARERFQEFFKELEEEIKIQKAKLRPKKAAG